MHEESHKKICEMREHLIDAAKAQMDSGIERIDTDEMGKVIDMIKDLYQAEKYRNESCYYASIVEAMEESSEDETSGKSTHFEPMSLSRDKADARNMRMRYPREDKGMIGDWDPRYGRAYNDYRKARKSYSVTKSASDKEMMDEKAGDHLTDSIHTIHEIWDMADPNLRKKMKTDLQKLVGEMTV